VKIYSDPAHPLAPAVPFDGEGLPLKRTMWIENGVLKNLSYSRYWAQKQGKEPTANPANIIMDGGTATMGELIKGVDHGILVTRFWYIRSLDPQTLLFTGLTRDGLFLIEKGQVTRAIKNMRWNESPIFALNNLDAMTPPERVVSGEGLGGSGFSVVCPAARIREFTFSSGSDAV
jgi:predicted Zn-dependent protease